ncbi:MAG: serine/threonine-protein kinase [Acidobacteriota bacterium]
MSDTRHAKVREIFLAASERSPTEWSVFLTEACDGDDELRREVLSLLSHHEELDPIDPMVAEPVSRATRPGSLNRTRFETGHIFAGRYRIISELGRGGMGEVFRAHDRVLDEEVAIKFLPRRKRRHVEHLLNEVRMARQVTHPNVCRVFDFGEADGETFLTMEYIDGENLASLLGRIGRLSRDKLLDLAQQLASGLAAAHARGVLHRDLKPANIMIDGRGQARITDFGISSPTELDQPVETKLSAIAGTPAYMAPEQLTRGEVSVQSDLYSLGLVLHEMATGQPVFEAKTPAQYAELHRASTPTTPSQQVEHLDPRLEEVIIRCLEKQPQDRPSSARAILSVLPGGDPLQMALEAGETPSPEMVAAARRGTTLSRRGGLLLVTILGALLVGLLALGDLAFPSRAPWSSRPPEVLVEQATTILQTLGYTDSPVDRAWGFTRQTGGALGETGEFWYRQATSHLVPTHMFVAEYPRIDYIDPQPDEPGMIRLLLDADDRLLMLHVVPEAPDEAAPDEAALDEASSETAAAPDGAALDEASSETPAAPRAPPPEVDWSTVLGAAGLDAATLETVKPGTPPPVFADQRAAWAAPEGRALEQIEAAAYQGRVIYFDAREEAAETAPTALDFDDLWVWYLSLYQLFWFVVAIAALLLARANLRAGRGDLRGARRLAFFVILVNVPIWLLQADHVPDFQAEAWSFQANLGRILLEAAVAWLAYIALEPTVRRWWPRALIAWSRLLRGQLADPVVGSSLLIGSVAGSGWVLATYLDRLLARGLGLELAAEIFIQQQLEIALAGRLLWANLLDNGVHAIAGGVFDLFFLVALRVGLKRWWLAVAIFVITNGTFETLEGIHPMVSWLTLGVGIAGSTAYVLIRCGLLAYSAALCCYYILLGAPTTPDSSAWFFESGLFSLALVAGLGLLGFWLSRSPARLRATPGPITEASL